MPKKSKEAEVSNVFYHEGAEFVLDWDEFKVDSSVFIPTYNTEKLKKEFTELAKKKRMRVISRIVVEDDMYGLRFWRVR